MSAAAAFALPPPPLGTPITAPGVPAFGSRFEDRPLEPVPAGDVSVAWATWFNGIQQRMIAAGLPLEIEAVNGAINVKNGTGVITKAGAAALMTLGAPVAGPPSARSGAVAPGAPGGDDGKILLVFSTTLFAHVITTPANILNGNKLTATFAGAVAGEFVQLFAYQGIWYVLGNAGIVLA